MNINDAFKSQYAKASDLKGKIRRVTIKDFCIEPVGQGADQEDKPVLHFKETDQALVLNRTNADIIKAGMGEDTDAWLGRQILLCPDTTMYQGKQVACIRVKVAQPPAKGAAPAPQPELPEAEDDDVPY